MNVISFDLETAPDPSTAQAILEAPIPPDSRLKDKAKIQAREEKIRGERAQKAALDGVYGQIISIHFAVYEQRQHTLLPRLVAETDGRIGADYQYSVGSIFSKGQDSASEREMLIEFEEFLDAVDPDQTVTYNGAGFDWPFLRMRMMRHGILNQMPRSGETGKYQSRSVHGPIVDMLEVLTGHQQGSSPTGMKQNLSNMARFILRAEPPEGHSDKLSYAKAWESGDFVTLGKFGEWDAVQTLRLFMLSRHYF